MARGVPYAEICARLSVPKSTLSVWHTRRGRPRDTERQLRHLRRARKAAARAIKKRKEERIRFAAHAASRVVRAVGLKSEAVGKALLAMLYWTEGGKQEGNMKFTNTDPELVRLFVALLRNTFDIDESRFRVALQIHEYHDVRRVTAFWSRALKIPKSQFWKPYLKKRGNGKKYRKNFAGICNVHYASSAIQRELMALGHEIARSLP